MASRPGESPGQVARVNPGLPGRRRYAARASGRGGRFAAWRPVLSLARVSLDPFLHYRRRTSLGIEDDGQGSLIHRDDVREVRHHYARKLVVAPRVGPKGERLLVSKAGATAFLRWLEGE